MHVIFLAKDNHTDNPTFLLFLELGMSRGHTVQAWNKKTFLAGDLSGVDVVCLKSYIDDHQVWKVIESQGVRAINSRAASEHCLERLRLDMLLGAGGVRTPRYASSPNEVTGMSYPIIRKPNAMFAPRELRVFHNAPAEIDCKRYFYQLEF